MHTVATYRDWRSHGHAAPHAWLRADTVDPTALHNHGAGGVVNYLPARSAAPDLDAVSCSTHKEATTRRPCGQVSGGWLVACTAEGHIWHIKDYYGAESYLNGTSS